MLISAPLLMRNSTGPIFESIACRSARHCRASNERRRDAPDVRGWRTSAVRGEEAGCFRIVAAVFIIVAGSQLRPRVNNRARDLVPSLG